MRFHLFRLVGLLGLTLPGSLLADTIYNYTGAEYNVSSGCGGTYCSGGPYTLSITFDVAAGTQLDSLYAPSGGDVNGVVDITADVTSFTASDGSGFTITQANTIQEQFAIATDANGNVTAWTINVCAKPPYLAPGSSAAEACMDTYWYPSYPQVLDRTNWTDGSEDGQCFAYGAGVVQTSNCLGTFTKSAAGASAPEPANLLPVGAGVLALLAFKAKRGFYSARTLWTN